MTWAYFSDTPGTLLSMMRSIFWRVKLAFFWAFTTAELFDRASLHCICRDDFGLCARSPGSIPPSARQTRWAWGMGHGAWDMGHDVEVLVDGQRGDCRRRLFAISGWDAAAVVGDVDDVRIFRSDTHGLLMEPAVMHAAHQVAVFLGCRVFLRFCPIPDSSIEKGGMRRKVGKNTWYTPFAIIYCKHLLL